MSKVVALQPGAAGPQEPVWMSAPLPPVGCPPGLEYLTKIDKILCGQVLSLMEMFTGWESNSKFVLKNSMGQQIYYAFEESDCCYVTCCGAKKSFTFHVVDNSNKEVMRIHRPFSTCGGLCMGACFGMEVQVEAPPGTLIGVVKQAFGACSYNFEIQNAARDTQLLIKGPGCQCNCCADIEYGVYALDGDTQVGSVTKHFAGIIRETFTEADNYGISFPLDLDVKTKATLIGSMLLIDYMTAEAQEQAYNYN